MSTQQNKSQYPKEVLEIHHEFETAGERLLAKANEILNKPIEPQLEKGKRLLSVGFKQAQEAGDDDTIIKRIIQSEETIKLIHDYHLKYPNNKFITEEQVKQICNKYNLVCGEVKKYKGFVPEKNLKQIENFKKHVIFAELRDEKNNLLSFITGDEMTKNYWNIGQGGKAVFTKGNEISDYFSERINAYFDTHNTRYLHVNSIELQICAPVKDMDLTRMNIVDGYKMIDIPDPVVLQPIKGGYLIVTAWGDEASDELVVNQSHN